MLKSKVLIIPVILLSIISIILLGWRMFLGVFFLIYANNLAKVIESDNKQ